MHGTTAISWRKIVIFWNSRASVHRLLLKFASIFRPKNITECEHSCPDLHHVHLFTFPDSFCWTEYTLLNSYATSLNHKFHLDWSFRLNLYHLTKRIFDCCYCWYDVVQKTNICHYAVRLLLLVIHASRLFRFVLYLYHSHLYYIYLFILSYFQCIMFDWYTYITIS